MEEGKNLIKVAATMVAAWHLLHHAMPLVHFVCSQSPETTESLERELRKKKRLKIERNEQMPPEYLDSLEPPLAASDRLSGKRRWLLACDSRGLLLGLKGRLLVCSSSEERRALSVCKSSGRRDEERIRVGCRGGS